MRRKREQIIMETTCVDVVVAGVLEDSTWDDLWMALIFISLIMSVAQKLGTCWWRRENQSPSLKTGWESYKANMNHRKINSMVQITIKFLETKKMSAVPKWEWRQGCVVIRNWYKVAELAVIEKFYYEIHLQKRNGKTLTFSHSHIN